MGKGTDYKYYVKDSVSAYPKLLLPSPTDVTNTYSSLGFPEINYSKG